MRREPRFWALPIALALLAFLLVVGGQLGLSAVDLIASEGVQDFSSGLPKLLWPLVAIGAWALWFAKRSRAVLWLAVAATTSSRSGCSAPSLPC